MQRQPTKATTTLAAVAAATNSNCNFLLSTVCNMQHATIVRGSCKVLNWYQPKTVLNKYLRMSSFNCLQLVVLAFYSHGLPKGYAGGWMTGWLASCLVVSMSVSNSKFFSLTHFFLVTQTTMGQVIKFRGWNIVFGTPEIHRVGF